MTHRAPIRRFYLTTLFASLMISGVAVQAKEWQSIEVFICAVAIYLILNFIIVQLYALLECRLTPVHRVEKKPLPVVKPLAGE